MSYRDDNVSRIAGLEAELAAANKKLKERPMGKLSRKQKSLAHTIAWSASLAVYMVMCVTVTSCENTGIVPSKTELWHPVMAGFFIAATSALLALFFYFED